MNETSCVKAFYEQTNEVLSSPRRNRFLPFCFAFEKENGKKFLKYR